jgi:hypothetical protein
MVAGAVSEGLPFWTQANYGRLKALLGNASFGASYVGRRCSRSLWGGDRRRWHLHSAGIDRAAARVPNANMGRVQV